MICQGSTCRAGRAPCQSPALCRAMHAPIERASFLPRDQAKQDARRKRNRQHCFLTLAVLGALILARLALRHFFPGAFT